MEDKIIRNCAISLLKNLYNVYTIYLLIDMSFPLAVMMISKNFIIFNYAILIFAYQYFLYINIFYFLFFDAQAQGGMK